MSSPYSNGRIVRFIGRNRVQDGFILSIVSLIFPVFPLIQLLIYKISTKKSWMDAVFQLFNIGSLKSSPSLLQRIPLHRKLRIVCISDTHMRHARFKIPNGDILGICACCNFLNVDTMALRILFCVVHCGDFTNHGSLQEIREFSKWLASLPHRHKIIVPGNHDMLLDASYYDHYWGDWSGVKESAAEAISILTAVPGTRVLIDEGSFFFQ